MRKFVLQTQVSADGFMAGPQGEMDWITMSWTPDLIEYVGALTEPVTTIVMGRTLAEGFIPTWAERRGEPGADTMNDSQRVVLSRTLTESPWENAEVSSDLARTVADLKSAVGGDIIAYGGGTLVRSLIEACLIDDLHLFVNPTAIGSGMSVFPAGVRTDLEVAGVHPFACGVTVMHYTPR